MSAKRDLTFAYNGYCVGGESLIAETLNEHRIRDSYPRFEFECDVVFVLGSDALAAAEVATAQAAFRAKSKNFGLTTGERITGTDGVANGTTTFTSATGGFAATDVGLPLNIEGVGAFQITAYTDTNTVTVAATIASGTGLTWRVGYVLARITPATNQNGMFLRADLEKPGDEDIDTNRSRLWVFRAGCELPADNAGDGYRRDGQYTITYAGSRQRVVTLSGTYTGGGGNSALTNYLAGITAWATTVLAPLGGISTYQKIAESPAPSDDEGALLAFSVTYREVIFDQSAGGLVHAAIRRDTIGFKRTGQWQHGQAGQIAPVRGRLSYACEVDKTVTTPDQLLALYTGTIKPYLLAKASTLLGGTPIIEGEDYDSSVSTNTLASVLDVILAGLGSDVLEYSENVTYSYDAQIRLKKRWDGRPYTYNYSSPGPTLTATQIVGATTFGGGGGSGAGALLAGAGAAGGASTGFGSGNAFGFGAATVGAGFVAGAAIDAGGGPGGGGGDQGGGGSGLFGPTPPPEFGASGGKWLPLTMQEVLGRIFVGRDVDSQGQVRAKYTTFTTQTFVWISPGSKAQPAAQGKVFSQDPESTQPTTLDPAGSR